MGTALTEAQIELLWRMADKPVLFQADRLHPTSSAQPIILNNIWPHLAALMKKQ